MLIIASCVAVVALVINSLPSAAQGSVCKDRKQALKYLEQIHKEELVFRGVSALGHITLVHFNNNTGAWTASIIRVQNPTVLCGVDSGTDGDLLSTGDGSTLRKQVW
tara:strand:+ start:510 stop:830 length:321 start_codon:yes stop_codon:yes gene_type:complete